MKKPDLERIASELKVPLAEFLKKYNAGLPANFPSASPQLLKAYRTRYPGQFEGDGLWSLDLHRKKFMDWLPMYLKSIDPS